VWRAATTALCLLAALAATSVPALGGSSSSTVPVNITLTTGLAPPLPQPQPPVTPPASGVCTSASLSESTGAVVRVVCSSGQFVSISPNPGAPFVGTHGGAYDFYWPVGTESFESALAGGSSVITRSGRVTSFRVYSLEHIGDRLDVLVSF
jgi:hypothetical protein